MKALFADTYYYLAFLNREDENHQRALALSKSLFVPILTTREQAGFKTLMK